MTALTPHQVNSITQLCDRFGVESLSVFGSAASASMNEASDVDFVVRFHECSPREHYERYFGLIESLERLLARPIDLVEEGAMKNPYFIEDVLRSRVQLYAA